MSRMVKSIVAAAACAGLVSACGNDPKDMEAAQFLNLNLTRGTPHGSQGLGQGGRMTDDWIYPEPEGGAHGAHSPNGTTTAPDAQTPGFSGKGGNPEPDRAHTEHKTPQQATPHSQQ